MILAIALVAVFLLLYVALDSFADAGVDGRGNIFYKTF